MIRSHYQDNVDNGLGSHTALIVPSISWSLVPGDQHLSVTPPVLASHTPTPETMLILTIAGARQGGRGRGCHIVKIIVERISESSRYKCVGSSDQWEARIVNSSRYCQIIHTTTKQLLCSQIFLALSLLCCCCWLMLLLFLIIVNVETHCEECLQWFSVLKNICPRFISMVLQ